MGLLSQIDLFPKTLEDFKEKTFSGAVVSVCAFLFMTYLFFGEFYLFMQPIVKKSIDVDVGSGNQTVRINMNMIFPKVPCVYLSIDAMDVTGETQMDVFHSIYRRRLDRRGRPLGAAVVNSELYTQKLFDDMNKESETEGKAPGGAPIPKPGAYCGSCYGAEMDDNECCNTCNEVRAAYRRKGWAFTLGTSIEQCSDDGYSPDMERHRHEGCHLYGFFEVNKVQGTFHIAPGKSFMSGRGHTHDMSMFHGEVFNFTHTIDHLSFGKEYPNQEYPLDNHKVSSPTGNMMYKYFLKVVPTEYHHGRRDVIETNQYSYTSSSVKTQGNSLPGVFFVYDLAPYKVTMVETSRSFLHFITELFAILGGVFAVMGILDSFVFYSINSLRAKIDLGKQF